MNMRNRDGFTPVMVAADRGYLQCVKLLVSSENINVQNESRQTALTLACEKYHEPCVDFLLTQGAHVNTEDVNGYRAVHKAAVHHHVDCLNKLIDSKAEVNVESSDGFFTSWPCSVSR